MARKGLKGVEIVMRNLNRSITKIKNRSMAGMIKAVIVIRRDTENSPPITPFDLGNLSSSWYVVTGFKRTTNTGSEKTGKFKGNKAGEMSSGHRSVISKQKSKVSNKPALAFGFSANYAAPVHNAKGKKFKRTGSGANFLSSSIESNKGTIIKIIKEEARIR